VLVESKTILAESPLPYQLTPLPLTHAELRCLP